MADIPEGGLQKGILKRLVTMDSSRMNNAMAAGLVEVAVDFVGTIVEGNGLLSPAEKADVIDEELRTYLIARAKSLARTITKEEKYYISEAEVLAAIMRMLEDGFYEENIFKKMFYDRGVIWSIESPIFREYTDIINKAPEEIKSKILRLFRKKYYDLGWDAGIAQYLKEQYHYESDYEIVDIIDKSVVKGIYKVRIRMADTNEIVEIFIKKAEKRVDLRNEVAFWKTVKICFTPLYGGSHLAQLPVFYKNNAGPDILIMPCVGTGQLSDPVTQKRFVEQIPMLAAHAALGDIVGRNDRDLGNIRFDENVAYGIDISNFLGSDEDYDWIIEDIMQGIDEMTLLTLLPDYANGPESRRELLKQWVDEYRKTWEYARRNNDIIKRIINETYGNGTGEGKIELLTERLKERETVLEQRLKAQLIDYETRRLYSRYMDGSGSGKKSIAEYLEKFRKILTEKFYVKYPGYRSLQRATIEEICADIEKRLSGKDREVLRQEIADIRKNAMLITDVTQIVSCPSGSIGHP